MSFKKEDIVVIKNTTDAYKYLCIVDVCSDGLIRELITPCGSNIKGFFPESSFRLATKRQIEIFKTQHEEIIHYRIVSKLKGNIKDYKIDTQPLLNLIETNNAKNLLPKLLKEFKKAGYTAITIGVSDKSVKSSVNWNNICPEMIFSYPDIYKPEPWPAIWHICGKFGFRGCGNSQQYQCCSLTIKYNWKSIKGVYNLIKEK